MASFLSTLLNASSVLRLRMIPSARTEPSGTLEGTKSVSLRSRYYLRDPKHVREEEATTH
jgi:hypothetical protein